jgi:hypothetical protein
LASRRRRCHSSSRPGHLPLRVALSVRIQHAGECLVLDKVTCIIYRYTLYSQVI